MGFNKRKMEDQRQHLAEKEAKALNLGIVYVALGQSVGLAVRKLPPRRRYG